MNKKITEDDYIRIGKKLNLEVPLLKAVHRVEAPRGGFDAAGLPTILFEGHWFSDFTNGAYDQRYPTISYPKWTRRFYGSSNTKEHARLAQAAQLDREAALKSASWGVGQVMGFNHVKAGFKRLQDFINAMYQDEGAQFEAMATFLQNDKGGRMVEALREHRWADFAEDYNGSGYKANSYDTKLADAYEELSRA